MPTTKQKKIAKLIINNERIDKPLNAVDMLVKVGYSENTAIGKPKEIMESVGVKQALNDLGFSEDGAKKVVAEILYNGEDSNRLRAADQVFKVHGSYAPEKHDTRSINVDLTNRESITKIAKEVIKQLQKEE